MTEDGFQAQFGINFLAPWLLTNLLLPAMRKAGSGSRGPARLVNVSSEAHNVFVVPPDQASAQHLIDSSSLSDIQLNELKLVTSLFNSGGREYLESASVFPFDRLHEAVPAAMSMTLGYAVSKLAQVLHVRELAAREADITAVAVHPGGVDTNMAAGLMDVLFKAEDADDDRWLTPWQGAQMPLFAALEPGLRSGSYYDDFELETWASPVSRDAQLAKRLWAFAEEQVEAAAGSGRARL